MGTIVSRIQLMDANRSILFLDRTKSADASWNDAKDLIIWNVVEEINQKLDSIARTLQSTPPFSEQISITDQLEQITSLFVLLQLFLDFVGIIELYCHYRRECEVVGKRVVRVIKKSDYLQKQFKDVSSYIHSQKLDLSDMPRIHKLFI